MFCGDSLRVAIVFAVGSLVGPALGMIHVLTRWPGIDSRLYLPQYTLVSLLWPGRLLGDVDRAESFWLGLLLVVGANMVTYVVLALLLMGSVRHGIALEWVLGILFAMMAAVTWFGAGGGVALAHFWWPLLIAMCFYGGLLVLGARILRGSAGALQ
jgi:hypothetical protein